MSASELLHDAPRQTDPHASGEIPADGLPNDRTNTTPPPSLLEWGVRIVSLSVLAILVGYLVLLGSRESIPAQFNIDMRFDEVEQRGSDWVLPLRVENTSTESVTELTLGVSLDTADGPVERTTTIYILGEGERVSLELMFPERPDPSQTEAHIHAYQSP